MLHLSMSFLVTGGAGYLGSHLVDQLANVYGDEIIVIDDFSSGLKTKIPKNIRLIEGNILDDTIKVALGKVKNLEGIFHVAAKKSVSESIANPGKYSLENVSGTMKILELCRAMDIENLVFTSSAAIYGNPGKDGFVRETDLPTPINPYGKSKFDAERLVESFCASNQINFAVLRIFNIAGAQSVNLLDSSKDNVIPILIDSMLRDSVFTIHGSDLDTADGTAVRDYIHVNDVVAAQLMTMRYLVEKSVSLNTPLNISSGKGTSILELISMLQFVSGFNIQYVFGDSRDGDPSKVIGQNSLARDLLGWSPTSDISKLLEELYSFYSQRQSTK